jgi:biopolymer transport protein ExbD
VSFREGGLRTRRQPVILELTPLIDCIFQLLVFFLLTASFVTTPNMGVELPKASTKAAASERRDLIVVVTREGAIQLDNRTLSPGALLAELRAEQKKRPDGRVLIQADTKAYHGQVVRVMDAAKAAGFTRLGVAIQRDR